MDQHSLNNYFSEVWSNKPSAAYQYSGWAITTKIREHERVLDVGCGKNLYKGKIKNLIGIDPAFNEADVKCTIEEYATDEKFDVALCLGSINFGTRQDIERQIAKVVSLLTPTGRIYWRCNPGRHDHGNKECEDIDFYPWSLVEHIRLAEKFGFRLNTCCWDTGHRLYAEWYRRQCPTV